MFSLSLSVLVKDPDQPDAVTRLDGSFVFGLQQHLDTVGHCCKGLAKDPAKVSRYLVRGHGHPGAGLLRGGAPTDD